MNIKKILNPVRVNTKAFSLVELLVVVVIIGVLAGVSFVAVQGAKKRALNERVLDDLVAIANSMEDYKRDNGTFPIPDPGGNQNVNCYYADATYAHDCEPTGGAVFRQGMVDNQLLGKRYLREVPVDPHTGSRYVYGVTNDGKFFQLAGLYEGDDGFEARTVENLARGFELPSIVRAYDGPNFVVDGGTYLPYNSDALVLDATLDNINGGVTVNGASATPGMKVQEGDEIVTDGTGSADVYLSDGSVSHIDPDSELVLKDLTVEKNDEDGTVTKILLKLNAGKIWSKVVRLSSNSEFRVETNSAIAGVRGTEFGYDEFGNVVLKSGNVWEAEKDELGIDNEAPDDDGNTDADTEDILAFEPPPVPEDPSTDPLYVEPTTNTALFDDYYADEDLHTGLRPHILSVEGGVITVRNINHFINESNAALAEEGLPTFPNRKVRVSRIAAYTEPHFGIDEALEPAFVTTIDLNEKIDPYLIDLNVVQTALEAENPPRSLPTEPVFLRFERLRPVSPFDLRRVSQFTQHPINADFTTSINQTELYPEYYQEVDQAVLNVNVQHFVTSDPNVSKTFNINFAVPDHDPAFTVDLVGDELTGAADCSFVSGDDVGDGSLGVVIPANADSGTCEFMVTADLGNGTILTKNRVVQIIEAASQLLITKPFENEQIVEDAGAIDTIVRLEWATPNAPPGVSFALEVSKDGETPQTFVVTASGTPADRFFDYEALGPGSYSWVLKMLNQNGDELEEKTSDFDVVATQEVGINWVVNETTLNISGSNDENIVVPGAQQSVVIDLNPSNHSPNFHYEWSFSSDHSDVLDKLTIADSSLAGKTVTLNRFDDSIPSFPDAVEDPPNFTPFSIIATVVVRLGSSTGNVVDSATVNLTFEPEPPNQITAVEFLYGSIDPAVGIIIPLTVMQDAVATIDLTDYLPQLEATVTFTHPTFSEDTYFLAFESCEFTYSGIPEPVDHTNFEKLNLVQDGILRCDLGNTASTDAGDDFSVAPDLFADVVISPEPEPIIATIKRIAFVNDDPASPETEFNNEFVTSTVSSNQLMRVAVVEQDVSDPEVEFDPTNTFSSCTFDALDGSSQLMNTGGPLSTLEDAINIMESTGVGTYTLKCVVDVTNLPLPENPIRYELTDDLAFLPVEASIIIQVDPLVANQISFVNGLDPGYSEITDIDPPSPLPAHVAITKVLDDGTATPLSEAESVSNLCEYSIYEPPNATSPVYTAPANTPLSEALENLVPGAQNKLVCNLPESTVLSGAYQLPTTPPLPPAQVLIATPHNFDLENPQPFFAEDDPVHVVASVPLANLKVNGQQAQQSHSLYNFQPVSDPNFDYVFEPHSVGRFEITMDPPPPGGGEPTPPPLPPIEVHVCDYVGDGSECWIMGTEGESCVDACNDPKSTTQPEDDLGLVCNNPSGDPIEGNWNDNETCDICKAIEGDVECSSNKVVYSPMFDNGANICRTRDALDFQSNPIILNCAQQPPAFAKRLCKCE